MANLARRDSAIDFNGDGNPDAYVHEIITKRISANISPNEDGAVGKILMVTIATVLSRPINTLKEFWGWGCLIIGVIYFLVAWGSSKPVIPETRNWADNFRPDVVGAGLGRTAKSVTTSVADSANAAEITPTSASLKSQTRVRVD